METWACKGFTEPCRSTIVQWEGELRNVMLIRQRSISITLTGRNLKN